MQENKTLRTVNNYFTNGLYQALFPATSSENLIFSPFSLHTVLAFIGQGARGETRNEIIRALKFNEKNYETYGKSYNSVISSVQTARSPETFTLSTANRVYCPTGFGLNQVFASTLKEHFQVDLKELDFSTAEKCQDATKKINRWVEAASGNKIKDLISEDTFGPQTRLVLVNGIYFKGFWEYGFPPEGTSKAQFHVTPWKNVEVDMMYKQEKFPYCELPELDAEAVALPYKGGRLSMVIILPKAVDGLAKIQSSIGNLQGGKSFVSEALYVSKKVSVSLPKFKIEATIGNLKEVLETLGIKSIFSSDQADLSGFAVGENPSLFVSRMIQKAFLEVGEEGAGSEPTELGGADSTGMYMMLMCLSTIPFVVDHPFYFQIVDHANGDLVLLAGHCNDPTK